MSGSIRMHSVLASAQHREDQRLLSRPYVELLRQARCVARRAEEAEDLLQTVLLAAVEAGRCDLSRPDNRRWLQGALRKRAAFDARSAVRRRQRETHWAERAVERAEPPSFPWRFVAALSPSLRATALLVLTGHTRQEIVWLQRLPETAFRQRLAEIRRRWRAFGAEDAAGMPGLSGALEFGRIRQSLLPAIRHGQPGLLASHDPDGHLFVIGSLTKPIRSATGERRLNHQE
jgi:DNA-directed RNA polymerase specialized sigma24 family protein